MYAPPEPHYQDLGGQTSIRPYWRCYYNNTAAVVFVIDSTDVDRLSTAAEELSAMLNEEELRDAALLVFANKQDQPGAKGAGDISEALRLGELKDRNWTIVACSAIDGSGVTEGMDWLAVCCYCCLGHGLGHWHKLTFRVAVDCAERAVVDALAIWSLIRFVGIRAAQGCRRSQAPNFSSCPWP